LEEIRTKIEEMKLKLENMRFSANVYRNGEDSGVIIMYEPSRTMTIYGLRPELPQVLRFENESIYGSSEGSYTVEFYEEKPRVIIEKEIKWKELDLMSGLQVFWLLDPRRLLHSMEDITTIVMDERGLHYFSGKCHIKHLNFPADIEKWFVQQNQTIRVVHFYFAGEKLSRLTQTDLPPLRDNVMLVFSYYD